MTLIGGSALLLQRTHQTALNAANVTLQNAASVIESVVNRQLLQVDAALVSLPTMLATAAADGQDLNAQSASRLLRGLNFQAFAFRDLLLVDPQGDIWASARVNSWNHKFPVGDLRSVFANPGTTASVVGPLRNPVTGDWVLLIMRPVQVAGVGGLHAVAELPLPLISGLFSAVGAIPGLRIMLERHNGELLVSQPYNEMQVGRIQPDVISQMTSTGEAFLTSPKSIPAPTLGTARATLYPDIMVVLTLDLDTAMADWVRDRNRMIGLVAVAVVLLSAMTLTLLNALRLRERADAERSKARAALGSAIEAMPDAFVMWDSDDRLVTCNTQYLRMYEQSRDFIFPGARFEDIIRGGVFKGQYPEASADVDGFVAETVAWHRNNHTPMERELPGQRWALVTERQIPGGGTVGIRTDITDLKLALADLAEANDRATKAMQEVQQQNLALTERDRALHIQNVLFDAALTNMSQGLLMTDRNERLIVHNKRFLDLFGITEHVFIPTMSASDLFFAMAQRCALPAATVESTYQQQRSLADSLQSGTFVVSDGHGKAISVSHRPIADGGWVATYEDVSEQRRAEEHIRFAAHHDALTRLPNRVLFRIRLEEVIANRTHRDTGVALLYLDLDRFKHVNDTLGHPIGDELLEAAGRRLRTCLRGSDIVARLGGDEFAIAYVSDNLPAAAGRLADRVITALSAPYNLTGHTVLVGASVGIALAGVGDMDADTLLKRGDMALYQAKGKGGGIWSLFENDMERQLVHRLEIEQDLQAAIEEEQFELLYQPLFGLASNQIAGFEALIRWHHPSKGTISPARFIQIAEETGLIHAIGKWVLKQACSDAMKLPDHIKMAVNLSARQFDTDAIIDIVVGALAKSGLPAHRLELEITETTLLKNNDLTLSLLFRLRELGLRIFCRSRAIYCITI